MLDDDNQSEKMTFPDPFIMSKAREMFHFMNQYPWEHSNPDNVKHWFYIQIRECIHEHGRKEKDSLKETVSTYVDRLFKYYSLPSLPKFQRNILHIFLENSKN